MGMVRSTFRQAILVVAALALLAGLPAAATAAGSTRYELPAATHAEGLAVAADGTAWFVPVRGNDWRGRSHSILGKVATDGTVSEQRIPGFTSVSDVAAGPEGDLWVSGVRGREHHQAFRVDRLSPAGKVLRSYAVGPARGERIAMAVSGEAVWFLHEHLVGSESLADIESVDISSGDVRGVRLPLGCRVYALAIAPDGTPWFTQKCGGFLGDGSKSKTSISHLGPEGEVVRQAIAAKDYPVGLAIGPEGTIWFGAWAYYEPSHIGRLTSSGDLAEYPIRSGSPSLLAVGPEGRLWFADNPRRHGPSFVSIGIDGDLGEPLCAEPKCDLEPTDLTQAPDGSLWYGLIRPNYNTGGGGSGIFIDQEIHNETGFVGHLVP
jgi:virginiamycin B lyase